MKKLKIMNHQPRPDTFEAEFKIFKHLSRISKPNPNLFITYPKLCVHFQSNLYLKLGTKGTGNKKYKW